MKRLDFVNPLSSPALQTTKSVILVQDPVYSLLVFS